MADNLESYFKKHLSDDSPAEDNWNVPSDAVWENVLPEIQKKRGLFIPLKYFYLLGGIVLAGLLLLLFWPASNKEIKSSAQYVQTEEQGNGLTAAGATDQIRQLNENSIASEKGETSSQTKLPSANEKQSEEEISVENNAIASGSIPDKKIDQNVIGEKGSRAENSLPIENLANLSTVNEREHVQISLLSFHRENTIPSEDSVLLPKTSVAHTIPVSETAQQKKKEPFDNKGKIGLGAFFAPTLTSTYINGNLSSGEMKAGNMFLYSGNWGFEVKYHISNRFALVTGIEKTEIKSWSKSLVDFAYDVSGEHEMESGEKENTSAVPMPTPFGEINTEITYRFPGEAQIPDGEVMQSVLETHQDVRYLSIPLGVEFNIIRFSRFSWFVEAGVRYNRALKDATRFTSRIIHQGDDMQVVAEEMTSHPSFTENYLSFYVGTGLYYQFSKSFQINTSVRYSGNITHVNFQDNMSTYVQGFNLKIGIVYLF